MRSIKHLREGAMTRQQRIYDILQESLKPTLLEITDDSAKHAGHAGASPEGQTHYTIRIATDAFAEKTTIAAHRMVYDALDTEFKSGLHALAIHVVKTPQ